jgi:3-methylfumaryl-CoA hydratase
LSLADALRDWQPGTVEMARRVDPWPAAAFAGLVGAPEPPLKEGDPLPPMWHWFTLLEHPATSEIGPDGHPKEGPFWPPIPGRKRMFAGGRLTMTAPIPVGCLLSSRASVAGVAVKSGRSGEMAFVTVRTELLADGAPAAIEEQDIVYRSEPEGSQVRVLPRPETGHPRSAEPPGDWRAEVIADEVLLFRFSALTYNGHRIHYDRQYATQVEGYPDLVIHGPLLALLALDLPRVNAPGRVLKSFEYRLVRPAFLPATIIAVGQVGGDNPDNSALPSRAAIDQAAPALGSCEPGTGNGQTVVEISVGAAGALPSLTAKAVL